MLALAFRQQRMVLRGTLIGPTATTLLVAAASSDDAGSSIIGFNRRGETARCWTTLRRPTRAAVPVFTPPVRSIAPVLPATVALRSSAGNMRGP